MSVNKITLLCKQAKISLTTLISVNNLCLMQIVVTELKKQHQSNTVEIKTRCLLILCSLFKFTETMYTVEQQAFTKHT